MFNEVLHNTKSITPLTHAITNYVTVNDCANIILAAGGSPIMADDAHEVEDITSICHSLVINMGTLNQNTFEAMVLAGKKANEIGHPVVLDPVAVGASAYRNECTAKLLEQVHCAVIRGNISEIKALANGGGKTSGVDANVDDIVTAENLDKTVVFAKALSARTGAVIAISGQYDIVANQNTAYVIQNGVPEMAKITGSGCMLTCVIGAHCGANSGQPLEAAAAAVTALGLCGELAKAKMEKEDAGLNSFRTYLIDFMSKLDAGQLKAGAKIEVR